MASSHSLFISCRSECGVVGVAIAEEGNDGDQEDGGEDDDPPPRSPHSAPSGQPLGSSVASLRAQLADREREIARLRAAVQHSLQQHELLQHTLERERQLHQAACSTRQEASRTYSTACSQAMHLWQLTAALSSATAADGAASKALDPKVFLQSSLLKQRREAATKNTTQVIFTPAYSVSTENQFDNINADNLLDDYQSTLKSINGGTKRDRYGSTICSRAKAANERFTNDDLDVPFELSCAVNNLKQNASLNCVLDNDVIESLLDVRPPTPVPPSEENSHSVLSSEALLNQLNPLCESETGLTLSDEWFFVKEDDGSPTSDSLVKRDNLKFYQSSFNFSDQFPIDRISKCDDGKSCVQTFDGCLDSSAGQSSSTFVIPHVPTIFSTKMCKQQLPPGHNTAHQTVAPRVHDTAHHTVASGVHDTAHQTVAPRVHYTAHLTVAPRVHNTVHQTVVPRVQDTVHETVAVSAESQHNQVYSVGDVSDINPFTILSECSSPTVNDMLQITDATGPVPNIGSSRCHESKFHVYNTPPATIPIDVSLSNTEDVDFPWKTVFEAVQEITVVATESTSTFSAANKSLMARNITQYPEKFNVMQVTNSTASTSSSTNYNGSVCYLNSGMREVDLNSLSDFSPTNNWTTPNKKVNDNNIDSDSSTDFWSYKKRGYDSVDPMYSTDGEDYQSDPVTMDANLNQLSLEPVEEHGSRYEDGQHSHYGMLAINNDPLLQEQFHFNSENDLFDLNELLVKCLHDNNITSHDDTLISEGMQLPSLADIERNEGRNENNSLNSPSLCIGIGEYSTADLLPYGHGSTANTGYPTILPSSSDSSAYVFDVGVLAAGNSKIPKFADKLSPVVTQCVSHESDPATAVTSYLAGCASDTKSFVSSECVVGPAAVAVTSGNERESLVNIPPVNMQISPIHTSISSIRTGTPGKFSPRLGQLSLEISDIRYDQNEEFL